MERLTKKRIDDGEAYLACVELDENECDGICTTCWRAGEAVDKLAAYEDTGFSPEEIKSAFTTDALINLAAQALGTTPERLRELGAADKEERVVVLPCKVRERWTDADGRAVRITAVIVSIEPFGTNINIYFDDEGATPDDAGRACAANWDYFSRHYTCIEVERAMEGKKDGNETSM